MPSAPQCQHFRPELILRIWALTLSENLVVSEVDALDEECWDWLAVGRFRLPSCWEECRDDDRLECGAEPMPSELEAARLRGTRDERLCVGTGGGGIDDELIGMIIPVEGSSWPGWRGFCSDVGLTGGAMLI